MSKKKKSLNWEKVINSDVIFILKFDFVMTNSLPIIENSMTELSRMWFGVATWMTFYLEEEDEGSTLCQLPAWHDVVLSVACKKEVADETLACMLFQFHRCHGK